MIDPDYQADILKVLNEEGAVAVADQFEIGRTLSKIGTLENDREVLELIAPELEDTDVLALFRYFRSFRMEAEWREEFESIFPNHVDILPEADPY